MPEPAGPLSDPHPSSLNIIGCGSVGRTLARLWHERGVFEIRDLLNRSLESARSAVEFVGAGRAVEDYARLEPADAVMISAPDEAIESCCLRLCESGALLPGAVVFHVSGSLASGLLEPARRQGASVASIHPVKSFADPELSVQTFQGTFAAIEGDAAACTLLEDALARIAAKTFAVQPEFKTIYHAATVAVSNYLVALAEVGLRCLQKSGIDRPNAMEVIGPILQGTVRNVIELGTVRSLTGPIARGEPSVVRRQCQALAAWDETIEDVYRSLGRVALELSAAQGTASPEALAAIRAALEERRAKQP
jgi:predicted short-subunit dehydrogenase-like oxidoreductase (DUF2520 family)